MYPVFKADPALFASDEVVRRHTGACGGPPEVDILQAGEDGLFAAKGTLRVPAPAYEIFQRIADPEENMRIFAGVASLNYRKLLEEDSKARTRLFEVSKTGRWRLLGIPFRFESTVFALEDWRALEIRFKLKKPGAMQHMCGLWRFVPVGRRETLVLFYNEAVPSFPLPQLLHRFAGQAITKMSGSLLEDLRRAAATWGNSLEEDGCAFASPP